MRLEAGCFAVVINISIKSFLTKINFRIFFLHQARPTKSYSVTFSFEWL